ncbi:hypothetical protein BG003_002039, partial [Podila horticola]
MFTTYSSTNSMLDEPVAEDDDPVDPPTIVDPNRPKVLISVYAAAVRVMMLKLLIWLWARIGIKITAARPQVSFLPLVADKGQVKPHYQRSLHKTLAILKQQIMQREFGSK